MGTVLDFKHFDFNYLVNTSFTNTIINTMSTLNNYIYIDTSYIDTGNNRARIDTV